MQGTGHGETRHGEGSWDKHLHVEAWASTSRPKGSETEEPCSQKIVSN